MPERHSVSHRPSTHTPSDLSAELVITARMLRVLSVFLGLIATPLLLAMVLSVPSLWPRWVGMAVLIDLMAAAVYLMTRRRRVLEAAWLMVVSTWVIFTLAAYTAGGVESPAIMAQLIVVVLAGMLLGWRLGALATAVSTMTVVTLAYLQTIDALPPSAVAHTPWSRATTLVTYVILLGLLQAVIMRTLTQLRDHAMRDARQRHRAETRLREVIDNAPFGALGFELRAPDTLITTDANLSASAVLDLDATRLLGMDGETVLAGPGGTAAAREIVRVAREGGVWESDDFAWRIGEKSGIFEMHAFQTAQDRASLFFSDVTEKRRAEAEIRHMAFHDELTELPNRALFYDHLHMALASAQRRGDHVGLIFLDLDNFKTLNDRYGHAFGDLLLVKVAERLRKSARRGDTVARIGGDEFTVLLPDVEDAHQAEAVVRKILAMLEEPLEVGNRTIHTTASAGVAIAPKGSRDAVTLVHQADLAMYHVKADGRGSYHFFEPTETQGGAHQPASADHEAPAGPIGPS